MTLLGSCLPTEFPPAHKAARSTAMATLVSDRGEVGVDHESIPYRPANHNLANSTLCPDSVEG